MVQKHNSICYKLLWYFFHKFCVNMNVRFMESSKIKVMVQFIAHIILNYVRINIKSIFNSVLDNNASLTDPHSHSKVNRHKCMCTFIMAVFCPSHLCLYFSFHYFVDYFVTQMCHQVHCEAQE